MGAKRRRGDAKARGDVKTMKRFEAAHLIPPENISECLEYTIRYLRNRLTAGLFGASAVVGVEDTIESLKRLQSLSKGGIDDTKRA